MEQQVKPIYSCFVLYYSKKCDWFNTVCVKHGYLMSMPSDFNRAIKNCCNMVDPNHIMGIIWKKSGYCVICDPMFFVFSRTVEVKQKDKAKTTAAIRGEVFAIS